MAPPYYATFGPSILLESKPPTGILDCRMNAPIDQNNRRSSERMSIEQEVSYRVLNDKAGDVASMGKTVNISSSGILFTTEHMLLPGRRVEISINWPAKLDNKCALKLVARGRIVRFQEGIAALEIMHHEFRTKSIRASVA
jgi:hypothetical protein